jgi:hypothetical protein
LAIGVIHRGNNGRMYKISNNSDLARCSALDVLTSFRPIGVVRVRCIKIFIIFICLLSYVSFHHLRLTISVVFVRNCLPSLLVIPLMFAITDCVDGIRFHSWWNKLVITFAATICAALWFECIVPRFYARSTFDLGDIFAMLLGWLVYLGTDVLELVVIRGLKRFRLSHKERPRR